MNEKEYEQECRRVEAELKPKLTAEFLETLAQAVRSCGWNVDHVESARFVEWCFDLAETPRPDLEPFTNP